MWGLREVNSVIFKLSFNNDNDFYLVLVDMGGGDWTELGFVRFKPDLTNKSSLGLPFSLSYAYF